MFVRCAKIWYTFLLVKYYNKKQETTLNINAEFRLKMGKHLIHIVLFAAIVALSGCNNAKLSVAEEQYARGEYYDASVTYKKVYNKLRAKEERPLRGQVA